MIAIVQKGLVLLAVSALFSKAVLADGVNLIPAPAALDPGDLPAGSVLRLSTDSPIVVPGARSEVYIGDPTDNRTFGCGLEVSSALFERTIPAHAEFVIESAKTNKLDPEGDTDSIFNVSSTGSPFVTQILCQNNENGQESKAFNMHNLACLFDVRIKAPNGATNPELVCLH